MRAKFVSLAAALPWPLPALLAWAAAGASWWAVQRVPLPPGLAWVAALAVSLAAAACLPAGTTRWRRALVALGFPLAAATLQLAVPSWAWLAAALVLLLAYPLRAWRDAPWFPTPRTALEGLATAVPGPPPGRILDAGCGLGDGLQALARNWPRAALAGVEWSLPLAWAARLRCRRAGLEADIRRGDLWAGDWRTHDLVYVFQRPESMARVWAKACRELAPGAWLVSLEFQVPGVRASAVLRRAGQRPVWIYAAPGGAGGRGPGRATGSIAATGGR